MKQTITVALVLLLLFFLCPMLLLSGEPLATPQESTPLPTATLPLNRTVTPTGSIDRETMVRVKGADGTVSTLTMADYLWRVVAAEMPASFELEALKAQTAAARTYALRKMVNGPVANHPDADVCTDIGCCQAYIDPAQAAANWGASAPEYTQKITEAVSATDGQVILYDGEPISAVFFSSAAGRTKDAVEVWGGDVPYLTSVESPEGEDVPGWHSTVTVPATEFQTKFLEKYPEADLSGTPDTWFGHVSPTTSGGVEDMDIGGVTVRGTAVRTLFGLRSASFTVSIQGENIVFAVTGYGHGVGMSQYGAHTLAGEGKTWQEIVKWYYTGVEIGPYEALSAKHG